MIFRKMLPYKKQFDINEIIANKQNDPLLFEPIKKINYVKPICSYSKIFLKLKLF